MTIQIDVLPLRRSISMERVRNSIFEHGHFECEPESVQDLQHEKDLCARVIRLKLRNPPSRNARLLCQCVLRPAERLAPGTDRLGKSPECSNLRHSLLLMLAYANNILLLVYAIIYPLQAITCKAGPPRTGQRGH